jgi:Histidine kinase
MEAFLNTNLANKKSIVNLLFFIAFSWILFVATPNFHSYYDFGVRNTTYMFLAGVALFFIHNVVLLPIHLKENNNRKYLLFSLSCIIAFILIEGFLLFDIINSMYPYQNIFGIVSNQFFNIGSLIKVAVVICIPLLAIAILSAIYCLLVYGFSVISPYLEAFAHIMVLTMLFALVVTVDDIKSKDVSLILPVIIVFYINTFWLTPILLRNKKTKSYLLGLLTLVLGYFLFQTFLLTIFGFPQFDQETGQAFTKGDLPKVILNIPLIIILIITLFLSFVYGYVRVNIKAKGKLFNIKLGTKESELKLLKSQVNPHFLFNTLNTLYATALTENAEKTGTSIAKLASLLRYMQKDIDKDFIPLENEIKYLQDYITIQKLRCAIVPQVETHFINIESQLISPGLFIPFVENAFKYGIDPSKHSNLSISVICSNDDIHFTCVNSYDDEFKTFHKEQGLGIGINNAKQRLELVYPKNHTFEIIKKNNQFSVTIKITVHAKN